MRFRLALVVICLFASTAFAQNGRGPTKSPIEEAFSRLEYRSIGPAIMGGRIADVEGVPGDPNVVYVASASGGLWKTTNGGVKWTPIFERQGTLSIGDIALAQQPRCCVGRNGRVKRAQQRFVRRWCLQID